MNKGVLQIVGGAALFGLIPMFLTWCHTDSALVAALGRAAFATLFTGGILIYRRERFALTWGQLAHYTLWSLILVGAILFYFLSIRSAGHAIPGMVIGLQPLFVALLARILFKEHVTRTTWLSFLLAILGIALLAHTNGNSAVNFRGILYALLSAVLLGVNFTYHLKFLGTESPYRLVFFQNALQVPVLCAALPFIHVQLVLQDLLPLAGLGIICTGLAYMLIYAGSKQVKKQIIGIFQMIENIIPVLTGIFLMQEKWGWLSFFGLLLVLAAGFWSMKQNAATSH